MKITGHGGAKGLAPGNTLAAFAKALEYQVDEIELDVRLTSDGQAVLVHDPQLVGADGQQLIVQDCTYAEIQKHKPDVTRLDEAITYINRRVPMYIEVKHHTPTAPIIAIIKRYLNQGWTSEDFRLASYDLSILRALHAALPAIQIIVIEDWCSIRAVKRAKEFNTKRISMLEYWLWPGFIRAMKRRGYEVYCFPTFHPKSAFEERLYAKLRLVGYANNSVRAHKWVNHGLAGVITDYPDLFTVPRSVKLK